MNDYKDVYLLYEYDLGKYVLAPFYYIIYIKNVIWCEFGVNHIKKWKKDY